MRGGATFKAKGVEERDGMEEARKERE